MMIGEKLMEKGSNYHCNLKVTGLVCKNQKKISININHNFHHQLPSL